MEDPTPEKVEEGEDMDNMVLEMATEEEVVIGSLDLVMEAV